jgi:hypothetical protein
MLDTIYEGHVYIKRDLTLSETKTLLTTSDFINAIGHEGTVKLVNNLLGLDLQVNRINIKLTKDDTLIVVQIKERLQEGEILDSDILFHMYLNGKVQFDLVRVI